MNVVESGKLRNVAVVGHGHTGKTSLVEAILFDTGVTNRLGRVEDGNTVTDFEPEEKSKLYSIETAVAACNWNKHRINLLDTPGGANFVTEAFHALDVADAALLTVCAASGVEVQTEKLWDAAEKRGVPRAFFINKLDRERANFDRVLRDLHDSFKINVVVLQLPIGQEDKFQGVIDVITGTAYKFDASGKATAIDVPADMAAKLAEIRTQTLEAIAENDEALMEKYLGGEELPQADILQVLRKAFVAGEAYPVLCGSSTKNVGVANLLDFVIDVFPTPLERSTSVGKHPDKDEEVRRDSAANAPFSAIVFKTSSAFAGTASMFRVLSGSIKADSACFNPRRRSSERLGHILKINGKNIEDVGEAVCGDIVAVAKLKDTKTGDTLCDEKNPVVFDLVAIPTPSISYSVHVKGTGDEDKVIDGLLRLADDDPTIHVRKDPQTREVILSGMGAGHIEVTMEKLMRRFKLEAELGLPKVPYRETIQGKATSRYRHKKQTGGRGQFGECEIVLAPLPRGGGYEFHDKIVGGVIPKTFIPAVDKGIRESFDRGPLAGFPCVDFQVDLVDGKFHDVDSSEQAFKMAGAMAFKQGISQARPVLLEPIQKLEIVIPEECTGDIMGDLSRRRGQVQGYETKGKNTVVRAQVPLSEILRYEPDLRSMTSGRGSFTSEFDHYQEVPHDAAVKVIEANKREHEEEVE